MLLRSVRMSLTLALGIVGTVVASAAFASPANATPFADTAGTSVEEAVDALASEGVINGCGDGDFCPWDSLTRGQLATVLTVALELEPSGVVAFDDAPYSIHAEGIDALWTAGITKGCTATDFCPNETLTRGQLATMLVNAFEVSATDGTYFDDEGDFHVDAAQRLAAAGIVSGCGDPLTHFCTGEDVARAHAAQFLARALGLVEPVELAPIEERRAAQAEIDAEEQRRLEAEAAAAAEAEAARKAAAEAEAVSSRLHIWEALAQCESGGNWSINTGNGYYGGLQFHPDTWRSVGGTGLPHEHSKSEQIRRGEILQQRAGWGQWPACSRKLGLS